MRVPIIIPEELWPSRQGEIEGTVVAVHVKPGDHITVGQVVAEVEVEKAVLAVESHVEGTVVEVHVQPGDRVAPGDPLVAVETG
ncbi:MAG: biotin/lipoyl-binding protein [Desulfurococcales archaeon]|nr:biotin/lipoyl-binding protein [Desulfurococcales archaeon]